MTGASREMLVTHMREAVEAYFQSFFSDSAQSAVERAAEIKEVATWLDEKRAELENARLRQSVE